MAAPEAWNGWPKPLDVGNGQACASFALDGSWLSLGCAHPRRGFVEFTGAPALDEAWRGHPDAVRRYRHALTLAGHAAVRLTGTVPAAAPDPRPDGRPRWSGADRSGTYQAEAWAAADQPAVLQRHVLRAEPDHRPRRLTLVVSGQLERPPFAEITEVSPLPSVPSRTSTSAEGTALRIVEPALPAVARLRVTLSGGTTTGWRVDADAARLPISWDPRQAPDILADHRLLDYRDAIGRWPATPAGPADWGRLVAETWRALPIHPDLGLVAGDQRPRHRRLAGAALVRLAERRPGRARLGSAGQIGSLSGEVGRLTSTAVSRPSRGRAATGWSATGSELVFGRC
jgi:hypothetical protein